MRVVRCPHPLADRASLIRPPASCWLALLPLGPCVWDLVFASGVEQGPEQQQPGALLPSSPASSVLLRGAEGSVRPRGLCGSTPWSRFPGNSRTWPA
eukprot:1158236-Pelagomonas_calceolata.AAC.3